MSGGELDEADLGSRDLPRGKVSNQPRSLAPLGILRRAGLGVRPGRRGNDAKLGIEEEELDAAIARVTLSVLGGALEALSRPVQREVLTAAVRRGLDRDARVVERRAVELQIFGDELATRLGPRLAVHLEPACALKPPDRVLAVRLRAEARHRHQHHAIFGLTPALLFGNACFVEAEPGVDVVFQKSDNRLRALQREPIVQRLVAGRVRVTHDQQLARRVLEERLADTANLVKRGRKHEGLVGVEEEMQPGKAHERHGPEHAPLGLGCVHRQYQERRRVGVGCLLRAVEDVYLQSEPVVARKHLVVKQPPELVRGAGKRLGTVDAVSTILVSNAVSSIQRTSKNVSARSRGRGGSDGSLGATLSGRSFGRGSCSRSTTTRPLDSSASNRRKSSSICSWRIGSFSAIFSNARASPSARLKRWTSSSTALFRRSRPTRTSTSAACATAACSGLGRRAASSTRKLSDSKMVRSLCRSATTLPWLAKRPLTANGPGERRTRPPAYSQTRK